MPHNLWQNKTVLVLDGGTRSALAVTRSLGRLGANVIVAADDKNSLAGSSRFAKQQLVYPDLSKQPQEFSSWLAATIAEISPAMVLPITDISLRAAYRSESIIREKSIFPFVASEIFEKVANKDELGRIAQTLGINVPSSLQLSFPLDLTGDIYRQLESFPFPAVIKPAISGIADGPQRQFQITHYLDSIDTFKQFAQKAEVVSQGQKWLLQQRIIGPGIGVFAICRNGESVATFCHKRILEKPPTGGVSVLSESIGLNEAPHQDALTLLRHLNWEGAAMVEFKLDSIGKAYLLEINPRFWGSLQLAIDCGRDFPQILARSFVGNESAKEITDTLGEYPIGQRLRWTMGTVDHFLTRCKQSPLSAFRELLLNNSLQLCRTHEQTRSEVMRFEDPWPFFCEVKSWLGKLFS